MAESTAVQVIEMSREIERRFMPVMSVDTSVQRYDAIGNAVTKLMERGEDYGEIPGTKKPTLLKPGAEKLCNLFGLIPRYEQVATVEDWTGADHAGEPFFNYRVKCVLDRGDAIMGEGEGSCSSWESKYRYRKSERVCPSCGKDAIIKGKAEYGGGWVCFKKKNGCGATFKDGDPAIEGQTAGLVENPDLADQYNTVLKMGKKRALVDAVLTATAASDIFTQDIEEFADQPGAATATPAAPTSGKPEVPDPQPKSATPSGASKLKPATISKLTDLFNAMNYSEVIQKARFQWSENVGDEKALERANADYEEFKAKQ